MRKIIVLTLMAILLTGCSKNVDKTNQIANPWTDCETLEEAETKAGFNMEAPTTIGEYKQTIIQNLDNEIIQVFYEKENSEKSILIRKGVGTEDISGDYNEYDEINVKFGDVAITEKGTNGIVYLATWNNENYSYSLYTDGIEIENIDEVITQIK